ncbi:MAG: response regulator [Desulfobacteraceae bacterium]|nr:response regulator [Desulfobacteraceae bacterium]MBC2755292.1 response regulator [Desulfobacteraceae bacterium]
MSRTILIIDQDMELTEALAVYLERRRFDVHLADSADMALKMINDLDPEIILADPNIPDPDNIAALQQIKSLKPKIQFIIYTLPDTFEKAMELFQSKAFDYIKKPVSSIELDLSLKKAGKWIALEKKIERNSKKIKDLKNAQALFQQLFDEVPCYITVQDKNFRITATNRLFKKDFGHEIGEFCYKIYKHRTTPCTDCPVAATFKDGRRHQTEEVVTSKSGEQYHVLTWTAAIRDEAGQITQVMEMATNITQIRQLQDHLTSLGLMLGSMSHGIKGMLTGLDGGIYLLETGINRQDPKRTHRAFHQIHVMVERIRKMILDILYFTKSRELEYREIELKKMIRSITDIVQPSASHHNIELKVTTPPASVCIEVDPDWFRSAMVNFLENAVDACSSDTTKDKHHILLNIFLKGTDHVCFEITDNGLGMDRETREKMFTLFFSSKGSKGTGLGLFIANHVIRQHGGTIAVESEVKTGSRFEISIPRTRPIKIL